MSLSTGEHILSFKLPTQSPPPACWEALPLGAVDSGVSERAPRCLRCTTRVRSGQQAPCHFPRAVKKGGFGHGRTCLPSAALFRGVCECGCISRMLTGAHTQRRWAPSFTSCAVRGFRARGSGESRRLPKPRPEARGQTRLPLEIAQSELVIPAECDLGDSGIQSKSVTISQLVAFFFSFRFSCLLFHKEMDNIPPGKDVISDSDLIVLERERCRPHEVMNINCPGETKGDLSQHRALWLH